MILAATPEPIGPDLWQVRVLDATSTPHQDDFRPEDRRAETFERTGRPSGLGQGVIALLVDPAMAACGASAGGRPVPACWRRSGPDGRCVELATGAARDAQVPSPPQPRGPTGLSQRWPASCRPGGGGGIWLVHACSPIQQDGSCRWLKGFLQYVQSFSITQRRRAGESKLHATNRTHISNAESSDEVG